MSATKKSNRNLIMLLLGLVILLLVYFLVFNRAQDETEALESELSTQEAYLSELEAFNAQLPKYLAGIEENKAIVTEVTAKLPADVAAEDYVLYLMDLANKAGAHVESITLGDKTVVSEFDCIINDEAIPVSGGELSASVVSSMDYEQLKEYLNSIYAMDDNTYLDSISVAYDHSTALLEVSSDISKLYLDYEGAEAVEHKMPVVNKGIEDLFGTVSAEEVAEEQPDEAETIED